MDISEIRNLSNEDLSGLSNEELAKKIAEIEDTRNNTELRNKFYEEFSADTEMEFPVYSERNMKLVSEQMPNAIRVAGKAFWEEHGYTIAKNAKGVEIIAPQIGEDGNPVLDEKGSQVFTSVTVFDISETNAFEKLLNRGIDNLRHKYNEDKVAENISSEPTLDEKEQLNEAQTSDDKTAEKKETKKPDYYSSNAEKDFSVYEKFDKQSFMEKYNEIRQVNRQALFPLAYMAANYASKLNDLKLKQDIIDQKISRREHKAERLEAKAIRRENTNKMFDELYAGKEKPAVIKAICERNEKKIAKIRDKKIPKNQRKLDKQKSKSVVNQRRIRLKFAQIDKMQSLSNVIKSFVIINPEKRREKFSQSLDDLHDASKRAIQCKIEKADMKIEKLTEKMFAKSEKYLDTYSLEEKITKQSERKNTLSQKLDKLQSLDKPFAQQENKVVDSISEDVKLKVDELEQSPEASEVKLSEFAEDLAVSCTETANEMNRTAEKEKAAPSVDKPSVFKEVEKIKSEQKTVQADKSAPTKEKKPVSQEEI